MDAGKSLDASGVTSWAFHEDFPEHEVALEMQVLQEITTEAQGIPIQPQVPTHSINQPPSLVLLSPIQNATDVVHALQVIAFGEAIE